MKTVRYQLLVLGVLLCLVSSAFAEISIGIGVQNEDIAIDLTTFPKLVPLKGYPVYYAPQVDANYFFYDGMYWIYKNDKWYASSWYNGPWGRVEPEFVPRFILLVPVRYYQQPPEYFQEWRSNEPPRWEQHWGYKWEQQRIGWNHWNRASTPRPAPIPVYQQQFSGPLYPRGEQQQRLRHEHYRYQPHNKIVQQYYKQPPAPQIPAPAIAPVPVKAVPPPAPKPVAPVKAIPVPAAKHPVPVKAVPPPPPKPVSPVKAIPAPAAKHPAPVKAVPPPAPKPVAPVKAIPAPAAKHPAPVKAVPPPAPKPLAQAQEEPTTAH